MRHALQINMPGYYVSGMIKNRFQILESTSKRDYFVWDSVSQNNIQAIDGSTLFFETLKQAEIHICSMNHS